MLACPQKFRGQGGYWLQCEARPPHTSPTVVLTGFTWKCGVGPSSSGNYKGNKVVKSSPTDTLPCMTALEEEGPGRGNCGVEKELPWLLHRLPEQVMRSAEKLLEEEGAQPAGGGTGNQNMLTGGRTSRGVASGYRGAGRQVGGIPGGGQGRKTERSQQQRKRRGVKTTKKTSLKIATWNKGGARQDLRMKRNEMQTLLLDEDRDCLGITEANLGVNADMEEVDIPGYVLRWDAGRENKTKKNSRVVVYVKEELNFELVTEYRQDDLMTELWLRLGHKGTRRALVSFIYREHKTWNRQDESVREQGNRLQKRLEARERVWMGTYEVFLLGDINLDLLRKDIRGYSYARMRKMLVDTLTGQGWVQLIKSHAHNVNRAGVVSQSLIDHIWTNTPAKV